MFHGVDHSTNTRSIQLHHSLHYSSKSMFPYALRAEMLTQNLILWSHNGTLHGEEMRMLLMDFFFSSSLEDGSVG